MIQTTFEFEGEAVPVEQLPIPRGWRLLIGPVIINEQTKGGIQLISETVKANEYLRYVGKVLAVGHDCYKHPKFQGGIDIEKRAPEQWCSKDDIVLFRQYAGQDIQLMHDGKVHNLKVLNDDEILAIVPELGALNVSA